MRNATNKNIYKTIISNKTNQYKKKPVGKNRFTIRLIQKKIDNNLQTIYNKLIDKLYPIKYEPQQF